MDSNGVFFWFGWVEKKGKKWKLNGIKEIFMHEIILNLIYMRVLSKSLYVLRVLFGHLRVKLRQVAYL